MAIKEPIIKRSTKTSIIKLAVFIFLCSIIYLNSIGKLEPTLTFLDSKDLTFKVGNYSLSIYEIIVSITVIIVTIWATMIISDFGEGRIRGIKRLNSANKALLAKFYQITIYMIAFFAGLSLIGIDFGVLAVFGGALGIGIGFGLQKITSNFISGLILLSERSISNDDLIELSDGTSGIIKHISGRFTLLETPDGKEIMIPNEDFMTNRVTSWTYSNKRARIEIKVGVAYNSDLEFVRKLMLDAAKEHPKCAPEPEPACFVREFADSSITMLLFFWVNDVTEGRFGPKSDVMISVLKKFNEYNIEIPFPQRDYNIRGNMLAPAEAEPPKKPK